MSERVVSATRTIRATPERIFDLLSDPSRHHEMDGSGTVLATRDGSTRLTSGSRFGMDMRLGPIPYRITSRVVEFQQDRLIAWQHFGGHRWRYELSQTVADDGDPITEVTESFDWSTSKLPPLIEWVGYPKRNLASIRATLDRLASLVED